MLILYSSLVTLSFIVIGYLFGNILFGDIFSIFLKKNVRNIGSGNVGGTNSMRVFGKGYGICVMFLDGAKSYIAIVCCWCIYLFSIGKWFPTNHNLYSLIFVSGLFTTIGHCFPIMFLINFKDKDKSKWIGGKGMMTTGGIIAAISPYIALITFSIWVIVVASSRYVSLGSMLCTLISPFFVFIKQLDLIYLFGNSLFGNTLNFVNESPYSKHLILFAILFCIMILSASIVLYRHKSNIKKIKDGNERTIIINQK